MCVAVKNDRDKLIKSVVTAGGIDFLTFSLNLNCKYSVERAKVYS